MIVDTMTHAEVFREIGRDRDNVDRWWQYREKEIYRTALKRTRFPWKKWWEYTSPRKNRYILQSTVLNRHYYKTGMVAMMALRKVRGGYEVFIYPLTEHSPIAPTVLLPHMYRRYAERTGMDASTPMTDIIKTFHDRNSNGAIAEDSKLMARSVRYNGQDHMAVCVKDGVMLGHMEGSYYKVMTFITYDMACGLQEAEFLKKREKAMTDKELYQRLREGSIGIK